MTATTVKIDDQNPRVQYTANGTQTIFDFPFPFFDANDVIVYLTLDGATPSDVTDLQTINTDYTVQNVGTENLGKVTFVAPPALASTIIIVRRLPIERQIDFNNSGDLLADTLNLDQDEQTLVEQDLRESILRSMVLPDTGIDGASFYDAGGNKIINLGSGVADADAANLANIKALIASSAASGNLTGLIPGLSTVLVMTALTKSSLSNLQIVYASGYNALRDGGGGHFYWDETSTATADSGTILEANEGGTGRWLRVVDDIITFKMFGAVGDYTTDDTAAINATMAAFPTLKIPIGGTGVFRYTGTLILPEQVIMKGGGAPKIATFPQTGGDKSLLRPGFKDQIGGSTIIFDGTGSLTTYTTLRSDRFASTVPMVIYDHSNGYDISGWGFIQDMDVLDVSGVLTTSANDNIASNYTSGMVITATETNTFDMTLFGYWVDAGLIIHSEVPQNSNPDYNSFNSCLINGGLAVIGNDTAAGPGAGLTGTRWVASGLYGADHHTRADGFYLVPVVYIDGDIASGNGIRGHMFTACNLRGLANLAVVTDHCSNIGFVDCVTEFSFDLAIPNADAAGIFSGTINTKSFRAFNLAATGNLGMNDYVDQITGPFVVGGAGGFDDFMVGELGAGVRLTGSNSDSIIQLTADFTSLASDWVLRRDDSAGDVFNIQYDGATIAAFDKTGGMRTGGFGMASGGLTIAAGVVTLGTFNNLKISGDGGSDDLDTINGGRYDGEIVILRAANSSDTITVTELGNIRLNTPTIDLDNSQDTLMLMWNGSSLWLQISHSDNAA